ncbi:hypothetical protein ACHWQZ_G006507 [Mnemiopsis leidyi]
MAVQCGIKISPENILIKDAQKGSNFNVDITFQNFSKNSKVIRLRGPETKHFLLKAPNEEQLVASGLVINATLKFDCEVEGHYEDKIIVFVDNKPVVVPIKVLPPSPKLEFESPVSFGISIPDGLVLTRFVDIKNNGKRAGNFRIDYAGDQPIKIFPCVGTIEPDCSRSIKIEFISRDLGTWEEIAGVELEGTGYMELRMYGEVRPSSLMLLNISGTSHLQLINFGSTVFECEKFQPAVLFNNGPTSLGFVIILEEGGVAQEIKDDEDKALPRALSSCITASPNQGGIGPYEKVVINFCFAPSSQFLQSEWERNKLMNKEFVLFMHIVPITTVPSGKMLIDAQYIKQNKLTPLVEVGVTGKAVGVDVTVSPDILHNLGICEVGSTTATTILLANNNTIPLQFNFSKIAHFIISPTSGRIGPAEEMPIEITFCPSQFGSFAKKIQLDILGIGNFITDTNDEPEPKVIAQGKLKVLKRMKIQVKGVCKVSNLNKNTKLEDIKTGARKQTKFDMYSSIRPSNDRVHSLTTFTKLERYSYVDEDYAYTEAQQAEREAHRDKYKQYVDTLRDNRLAKLKRRTDKIPRELMAFDNDKDLGIVPGCGLVPPPIVDSTFTNEKPVPSPPEGLSEKVLTSIELASRQASLQNAVSTTNNQPTTAQEKRDCSTRLTPQQMHQVVIGPSTIDFGEVAIRTVNTKPLVIVNHLDIHVFIQIEIDCRELRQSLPLTQVIPPRTLSKVDVVFESQKAGVFQRSVVYTVNNHIKQHINILAKIVTPELSISHSDVVLRPTLGVPQTYGYSEVIKLTNKTNGAAEFSWRPDKISPFAVRPSQGTVEPHSTLNCEVLYFPSVSSPLDAVFTLDVVEGNSERLNCVAEFASPSVKFVERRLGVGVLPLHVPHKVNAALKNIGHHHAFYQVLNPQPTPFCTVKPESGCIPVGGMVNLELSFFAVDIEKFDFKIDVRIRGGKKQTLRVGGSVEPPLVECDLDTFAFHGVHVGASLSKSFCLVNPMSSEAEIVYNLNKYKDFKLEIPHRNFADDDKKNYVEDNYYHIYLSSGEKVNVNLVFSPQQVASYDFNLPVLINDMIAPPPPTRKIRTAVSRSSSVVTEECSISTPCRRVTATAMFPVLTVDKLELAFTASPFTSATFTPQPTNTNGFNITNDGKEDVTFALDIKEYSNIFEQGIFRFTNEKNVPSLPALIDMNSVSWTTLKPGESTFIGLQFIPGKDCSYQLSLPLVLQSVERYPYRVLKVSGSLEPPKLKFSSQNLMLLPTPLSASIATSLQLTALNYTCPVEVSIEVEEIRSDDGDVIKPITVNPERVKLPPCSEDKPSQTLDLEINYCADKSTSFVTRIIFTDPLNKTFAVSVTGTSENCLLTNYPFVNSNPRFHLLSGETEYTQQYTPPTATPSTVSLLSGGGGGAQCDSAPPLYTPLSTLSLRDGARNAFRAYITPLKTHAAEKEEEEEEEIKEEESFLLQVLNSAERWISQMGWSNLPNPVSIPHTIWQTVLLKKGTVTNDGGKRKSVFELVQNLCGRPIPGIPVNPPIPTNAQERVKLLHWQLNTMITFLKVQGAKLTHVKAEWFLGLPDFLLWSHLSNFESGLPEETEEVLVVKHEKYSSQAWVDLVLQLAKVFVLVKVKPSKALQANSDSYKSLARSVYSSEERTLLAWLSHHYEEQRKVIWPENSPPTRWIVSFDNDLLDGLVLAALFSSYCPFLVKLHFSDMYLNVRSPEECFHNALSIIHALRTIGMDYDIHPTDIMQPNAINMLLFVTHLYITLPQYKPKTTVMFEGALHQPVFKELKIQNPSSKTVSYCVTVVGEDRSSFSVQPNTLNITSNSHALIKVRFSSSWLHPCDAALMLVSRRTGVACGSTLVFSLQSLVNDIVPISTVRVETSVYKLLKFPLSVTNPLGNGGNFKIALVESKGLKEGLKGRKKHQHNTASDTTIGSFDVTKATIPTNSPSSFWCSETAVQLAPGGTANLDLEFLPLSPGPRNCALLFSCPGVGEFLQNIEGMGLYPEPLNIPKNKDIRLKSPVDRLRQDILGSGSSNVIRYRCDPEKELEEVLQIPAENPQKVEALIETAQHRMSEIEIRRRKLTGTLASASVACLEQGSKEVTKGEDTDHFMVHCNSKHFVFPERISCHPVKGARLPFTFQAEGQGFYPAKVVLVNSSDIRVYELEVTCTPSTTQAEILFSAPTMQSVVQEIPIINETQHDWNLSAVIQGDAYLGPPTLLAKSSSTSLYPLMFKPLYQGEIDGELTLTNVANGTVHKFKLTGTGLKPLPQETVTLRCHARQKSSHTVYVHNPSERRKTFQAYTDLDCIVGLHEISIEGGISVPYEITAYPIKQGVYKGVFSFESIKGSVSGRESTSSNATETHSVWYSVEIIVDPPPPEKTVDLFCEAKKALTLELSISNPTDKCVTFYVVCEGEGVSGPDTVSVGPKTEASYEILYKPTFIGKSAGKVVFVSEELGEFWYELKLNAEKPRPVSLPQLSAELGKSETTQIPVRNDLPESCLVHITLSNTSHFILHSQRKVSVPGNGKIDLDVTFVPSSLGTNEKHTCHIEFSSPQLGEWSYTLQGQGIRPTVMDPVNISCSLGQVTQTLLPFKNPLDHSIAVSCKLLERNKVENKDVLFELLMSEEVVTVTERGILELPFTFRPLSMNQAAAFIVIEIQQEGSEVDGLKWQFPIKGTPVFNVSNSYQLPVISCKSKERKECFMEIILDTNSVKPAQNVKYTEAAISERPTELKEGWKRKESEQDFKFSLDENNLLSLQHCSTSHISPPGLTLITFTLVFAPGKPVKKTVHLTVDSADGGRWVYPFTAHSTPPDPDDNIVIRASGLHKDSVVGIRLNSLDSASIPYEAYLEKGSDPDFRVYPTNGQLLPLGTEGTLICVAYKPTLYGKTHNAKLIVQTPTNQWSYVVQGQSPAFSVPVGVTTTPSRVPRPSPGVKKNFIRQNMRVLAQKTP